MLFERAETLKIARQILDKAEKERLEMSKQKAQRDMRHSCAGVYPVSAYGAAITQCDEAPDGSFWAGNGEYESRVDYCPYCGKNAPLQTPEEEKSENEG